MVERSLSMREAPGSIPGLSIHHPSCGWPLQLSWSERALSKREVGSSNLPRGNFLPLEHFQAERQQHVTRNKKITSVQLVSFFLLSINVRSNYSHVANFQFSHQSIWSRFAAKRVCSVSGQKPGLLQLNSQQIVWPQLSLNGKKQICSHDLAGSCKCRCGQPVKLLVPIGTLPISAYSMSLWLDFG